VGALALNYRVKGGGVFPSALPGIKGKQRASPRRLARAKRREPSRGGWKIRSERKLKRWERVAGSGLRRWT